MGNFATRFCLSSGFRRCPSLFCSCTVETKLVTALLKSMRLTMSPSFGDVRDLALLMRACTITSGLPNLLSIVKLSGTANMAATVSLALPFKRFLRRPTFSALENPQSSVDERNCSKKLAILQVHPRKSEAPCRRMSGEP